MNISAAERRTCLWHADVARRCFNSIMDNGTDNYCVKLMDAVRSTEQFSRGDWNIRKYLIALQEIQAICVSKSDIDMESNSVEETLILCPSVIIILISRYISHTKGTTG